MDTTTWQSLHGFAWPEAAAAHLPAVAGELAAYRPAAFLAADNLFEAAVLASKASHGLNLWEPFAGVAPVHVLGGGDLLCLFLPRPATPVTEPATVVWNHERDVFERTSPEDLREAKGAPPLPRGDDAAALRFTGRAAYLVELLSRGQFNLSKYLACERLRLQVESPAFLDNVRAWTPTAVYAMWHLYFLGDDAGLAKVLAAAAQSPSRWSRDSAALVQALLAGRDEVGALKGARALRAQVSALLSDPGMAAKAAAAKQRNDVDRRLQPPQGPARLVRDDAAAQPATLQRTAQLGDAVVEMTEARPHQWRLVLRDGGRALSAIAVRGTGGAPELEPTFHVVQTAPVPVVALWKRGAVSLYGVVDGRLALGASWEFDVDHLERREGALVVRTPDGAGYRLELDAAVPWPAPHAIPALPGRPAEPPAQSPPLELDGDRLELSPTSLKLWRGEKLLFEEPLVEAWAMTVLPERRMVAVHRATAELRPVVDVLFVRPLTRKVKAGEGCCTWVSFPCDGKRVALRSTGDALFVGDGAAWVQIDAEPLTTVPAWIQSRGWLK